MVCETFQFVFYSEFFLLEGVDLIFIWKRSCLFCIDCHFKFTVAMFQRIDPVLQCHLIFSNYCLDPT
ncbi:hypothetical protein BEN30_06180 [Magnetovibrio blakemorei]|uniref:Uncharacterized protein n=1 Tax=Magnetovibrio blakemorei TaxID=28181 RepID=A0A1E5QAR8_9PROT|nr:hypothetical protein BEN30_06180 [Magnetovibrio blakemorei]